MARKFSRRELLTASAAAGLSGCSTGIPVVPALVSIIRAPRYDQNLYDTIRRILVDNGVGIRGRSVVVKPNLVEFEPGSVINTHPLVVHATLEALMSLGAAEVRIAEGPGHRRNTLDLADAAGYFQTVPQFEDRFVDLNTDDVSPIRPRRLISRLEQIYLPNTALRADLLISLPKMKTHHWVGATLSMKNLFGVVPGGIYGWPKNVLHWAGISESIADLHAVFPRQFAIVDGVMAMEGDGPIRGVPKPMGILVAGRDPVAVDATCCRIMGIDPRKIEYLTLASAGAGARLSETNIQQIGEPISRVAADFELPPGFSNLRIPQSVNGRMTP